MSKTRDSGRDDPASEHEGSYRVSLSSSAVRSLKAIPPRYAESLVTFAFAALAENPQRRGKPLGAEFTGLWSARRGEYRIMYEIDEEVRVVAVVRFVHRAQAYRSALSTDRPSREG